MQAPYLCLCVKAQMFINPFEMLEIPLSKEVELLLELVYVIDLYLLIFVFLFKSPAAGLLRDPCPDAPVLVGFKGSLQAGPLRCRLHLSHGGGGHGGGRPAGWKRPGLQ